MLNPAFQLLGLQGGMARKLNDKCVLDGKRAWLMA
jgi:hypothetical protein